MRMHARAGTTRLPRHIEVQGVTPRVLKRSGTGDHKVKVDAMVFVRLGYPNLVVPLATSQLTDGHAAWYEDSAHHKHYGLTGEELVNVLRNEVIPRLAPPAGSSCYLVLDRHPAHRSAAVSTFMASQGMELILLPPYSPDLSPLDSNLFGVVKNRHSLLWPAATGAWPARAMSLLELLQDQDSSAHISSWAARLEKVVLKKGARIDRE